MTIKNERLHYIDFIKGLAVIFMVFQHLGVWFWDIPWDRVTNLLTDFPVYMAFNATGGFSAPAFVLGAGIGSYFFHRKYNSNVKLIQRGILLLLFGQIMNALVPLWFTPGSWYVLHLIGFCLIVSPLILKLKKQQYKVILLFIIFIITLFFQYHLKTPFKMASKRMGDFTIAGGVFRIMLFEGHFPVFPWIIFFISGIISAEIIESKKNIKFLFYSIGLFSTSALTYIFYLIFPFSKNPNIIKFFKTAATFYPLYPVMLFALLGTVFLSIFILSKIKFSSGNPIVTTGRLSLTIFFLHVVIFKQGLSMIGYYKYFPTIISFFLMLFVSFIFILLSIIWSKYKFKFSLEWILRKLS